MRSPENPERVVFDALRPYMSPAQATHEAHIAVTALRAAELLKEPCNCSPDPGREDGMRWEAGICGAAQPLTDKERSAFKDFLADFDELRSVSNSFDQAMRDIADEGEWPEVGA